MTDIKLCYRNAAVNLNVASEYAAFGFIDRVFVKEEVARLVLVGFASDKIRA